MTPDDHASDATVLSSLLSQVDDLVARTEELASRYAPTSDSAVAEVLYEAERGLVAARRALRRAAGDLARRTRR